MDDGRWLVDFAGGGYGFCASSHCCLKDAWQRAMRGYVNLLNERR